MLATGRYYELQSLKWRQNLSTGRQAVEQWLLPIIDFGQCAHQVRKLTKKICCAMCETPSYMHSLLLIETHWQISRCAELRWLLGERKMAGIANYWRCQWRVSQFNLQVIITLWAQWRDKWNSFVACHRALGGGGGMGQYIKPRCHCTPTASQPCG